MDENSKTRTETKLSVFEKLLETQVKNEFISNDVKMGGCYQTISLKTESMLSNHILIVETSNNLKVVKG